LPSQSAIFPRDSVRFLAAMMVKDSNSNCLSLSPLLSATWLKHCPCGSHAILADAVIASRIETLNDGEVSEYLDAVVKQTGKIDIVLDAAGSVAEESGNGKIATDLTVDEFMLPLNDNGRVPRHHGPRGRAPHD
jgi:hypothetical protein